MYVLTKSGMPDPEPEESKLRNAESFEFSKNDLLLSDSFRNF